MQKFISYDFNTNGVDQSKINDLICNSKYKIGDKVQFQLEQGSEADFRWKFVNGIIVGYSFDLKKYTIMYSIQSGAEIYHDILDQSFFESQVA